MILSVGRRCELVKYFKEELNKNGRKVIVADISEYAPALYKADKFYILKKDFCDLREYVDSIIKICKSENVSFLLTLIDPELELLSQYRNYFKENNITLIISDPNIIETTTDKYLFYVTYRNKLKVLKTYKDYYEVADAINTGELKFPIIAKLRKGSASIGMHKMKNKSEFDGFAYCSEELIYQEFISAKEIGMDVYVDLISGKIVSVFMKEKIAMRAGETDKSVSVFRKDMLEEILKLENCGDFKGPLDIDVFLSEGGNIYINEINPRFGGGYPHAHNCGVNFIKMIVNNINGVENEINLGNYPLNVKMMKYNGILFKNQGELYEG